MRFRVRKVRGLPYPWLVVVGDGEHPFLGPQGFYRTHGDAIRAIYQYLRQVARGSQEAQ